MFIVDYYDFKYVKYSNILHILTFYTTPRGWVKMLSLTLWSQPPITIVDYFVINLDNLDDKEL